MKRILRLHKKEGPVDLEIKQAFSIDSQHKQFHLEELPKGGYKLIWSKGLCENFSEIEQLEIVRED